MAQRGKGRKSASPADKRNAPGGKRQTNQGRRTLPRVIEEGQDEQGDQARGTGAGEQERGGIPLGSDPRE